MQYFKIGFTNANSYCLAKFAKHHHTTWLKIVFSLLGHISSSLYIEAVCCMFSLYFPSMWSPAMLLSTVKTHTHIHTKTQRRIRRHCTRIYVAIIHIRRFHFSSFESFVRLVKCANIVCSNGDGPISFSSLTYNTLTNKCT